MVRIPEGASRTMSGFLKQLTFEGVLAVALFDLHHPDVRIPIGGALYICFGLGVRYQLVAERPHPGQGTADVVGLVQNPHAVGQLVDLEIRELARLLTEMGNDDLHCFVIEGGCSTYHQNRI
jgi:hypothetical protein